MGNSGSCLVFLKVLETKPCDQSSPARIADLNKKPTVMEESCSQIVAVPTCDSSPGPRSGAFDLKLSTHKSLVLWDPDKELRYTPEEALTREP